MRIVGLAADSGEADSNRPTDHAEPWRHVNPTAQPTADDTEWFGEWDGMDTD